MGGQSRIEWTGKVWNPVVGCTKLSPGCNQCYAERMACRLAQNPTAPSQYQDVVSLDGRAWNGKTALVESALEQPLTWRKGCRIFVGSMTDLFHKETPDEWLDRVFAVMARCARHRFLILTKRPDGMREYLTRVSPEHRMGRIVDAAREMWGEMEADAVAAILRDELCGFHNVGWPMRNVWLGVTAENQAMADYRIPILLDTPAAKRFVSVEPMLGAVLFSCIPGEPCPGCCDSGDCHAIPDWIICGGESGPDARPMHPDWVRGLRDQCEAADVPFFFKQWGEWAPGLPEGGEKAVGITPGGDTFSPDAAAFNAQDWPDSARCMRRSGKKRAGRMLDGRTWNEVPELCNDSPPEERRDTVRKKRRVRSREIMETIAAEAGS